MKSLGAIVFGLVMLAISCQKPSTKSEPQPVPDGMPTAEKFEKGIKQYPYSAPPERIAKITTGLTKVERDMTKQQILNLLGQPDYSRLDYGPKGPGEKWLGSSWVYWLSKRDNGINMNDPCVHVFFDTKDRADWIVPSNIHGAHEIGGRN